MTRRIIIAAAIVALAGCSGAMRGPSTDPPAVRDGDLRRLSGAQWKGTLSYLDYRSNRKTTIPSNVTVTQSAGDPRAWILAYEYPDEPRANSVDTVAVSADGRSIAGETVVERTMLPDGTLRLVTRQAGKDNDRDATFRFTYLIGASRVSIRKEVMYEGSAEYFERNEYAWTR
jgi:hypothetical protein